jgi:hypothetical protein
MSIERSKENSDIFANTQPDPKDVWKSTFDLIRSGSPLNAYRQRALELREWCLVATDALSKLVEDPMIKTDALEEARMISRLGWATVQIKDFAVVADSTTDEVFLDTPLKLAEYIILQFANIDNLNDLPNVSVYNPEVSPNLTYNEAIDLISMSRRYLHSDAVLEISEPGGELEISLEEDELYDSSTKLWDELAVIIKSDREFRDEVLDQYLSIFLDPTIEAEMLSTSKKFPKRKGGGYFVLGVSTAGIELAEMGGSKENLGTVIVMKPGSIFDNGYIAYMDDHQTRKGERHDTNIALRKAEQKIKSFKASCFK